jgi:hypothetical protein
MSTWTWMHGGTSELVEEVAECITMHANWRIRFTKALDRVIHGGTGRDLLWTIALLLFFRAIPVSDEAAARICACTDPATARAWLEKVPFVKDVDELFV